MNSLPSPLTRHVWVFGRVSENGVNCTRVPALTCTNCGRAKEKWKTRRGDKRGRKIARAENGAISRESEEEEEGWTRKRGGQSMPTEPLAHKSYSSSSVWCLLVRERVFFQRETYARIRTLRATCLGSDLAHKSPGQRFLRIPWKTARIISRLFPTFCATVSPPYFNVQHFVHRGSSWGGGKSGDGEEGWDIADVTGTWQPRILSLTNENSRVLYGQLVYLLLFFFFLGGIKFQRVDGLTGVEREIVLKRFLSSHLFLSDSSKFVTRRKIVSRFLLRVDYNLSLPSSKKKRKDSRVIKKRLRARSIKRLSLIARRRAFFLPRGGNSIFRKNWKSVGCNRRIIPEAEY